LLLPTLTTWLRSICRLRDCRRHGHNTRVTYLVNGLFLGRLDALPLVPVHAEIYAAGPAVEAQDEQGGRAAGAAHGVAAQPGEQEQQEEQTNGGGFHFVRRIALGLR